MHQSKMIEALSTSFSTQSSIAGGSQVPHLPPFENFNSSKENFKMYKARFENYLTMKGVFENKTLSSQMLLNSIGSEHYQLITSLIAPRQPSELSYNEIITHFEKHLCPKRNILVAQHRFLSQYQQDSQSIAEYVALLRRDITDCEFICSNATCNSSIADTFLRAQFIRGIRDNSIRENLLQSENSKFDEILEKALALEASKIDSRELANRQLVTSPSLGGTDVNKVNDHRSRSKNRSSGKNSKAHSSGKSSSAARPSRSKSRSRLNYRQLGLENSCLHCGRQNHSTRECRADHSKLRCDSCNKSGHVSRVCISTLMKSGNKSNNTRSTQNFHSANYVDISTFHDLDGVNRIVDIFEKSNEPQDSAKYYVDVQIEGRVQNFEVDSGAGLTLLPMSDFQHLKLPIELRPTEIQFRSYTSGIFKPLGVAEVNVEYNNLSSKELLFVVPSDFSPILGRTWIRHLGISLEEIDLQNSDILDVHVNSIDPIPDITRQYAEIFEPKIGCTPGFTCSLQLRPNSKPVFIKERNVPYALLDKVNQELDSLEQSGIISKIETSDWGSPLVIIPKPDGSLRLCVDYKIGVNKQLISARHPIRKIDDILNNLRNSTYFCHLDLYKAYLHIKVDEESRAIQTISTHRGTYLMNRLSFGIKSAPSEFNRILDQILSNLDGTMSYYDDIIIHGPTFEICKRRLLACLERLKKFDLHLNRAKCVFFQTQVQYLGYCISHNKISKCPKKVEAIVKMPVPQSPDELHRFLGMVTYYARFIPNLSTMTYPLRQLLQKDKKWVWSKQCQTSFDKLKSEILSDRVLIPFNPSLPVSLACDASPTGIAGVLSHVINDEERPIAFISRSLTKAEQNYSQLDREALAIIFCVTKFYMYLSGKQFTLITDNQPLTRIFHPESKLPAFTSARLLRYATFLQEFDYKVVHRKAEDHVHVDCLSRATYSNADADTTAESVLSLEVQTLQDQLVNQISSEVITSARIADETSKDAILSKLLQDLLSGELRDSDYSTSNGIIFKNERVVIPEALKENVLQELHRTHVGIVKMKQLARRHCFWKNIDKDIERMVKSCRECALTQKSPAKAPVHQWDEPQHNFERVHIDYAGPFFNHHFLVLVDSKSKWAEVRILKDAPTTSNTIELLLDIFCTHGFPEILVSDNATIFHSESFTTFCQNNGIIQKFSAPGHPATNGLAERYIQTLKSKLTAMEPGSLQHKVREILFRYRATPLKCGKTPAELYLNRNIRCQLDVFKPPPQQKNKRVTFKLPPSKDFEIGDKVLVRWYSSNKDTWKLGRIIQKYGNLHYQVELENGYSLKRHTDQLRKTEVKLKEEPQQQHLHQEKSTQPTEEPNSVPVPPCLLIPNADRFEVPNFDNPIPNDEPQAAPPEDNLRRSNRDRRPPERLRDYVV